MIKISYGILVLLSLTFTACSSNVAEPVKTEIKPLVTSAIPDQNPEKLQRQYSKLNTYLEKELGVSVIYKPVTDYTAAVTAFKVGDLDLVWFGGLTGVQARLQVKGAEAIAQRDIDAKFHSVFIANKNTGLKPIKNTADFQQLKGRTFTFGSESSTSGRLMPQYFLQQAGVSLKDFKGEAGFSGDHDKTIKLVESGSYNVGAVNEKIWLKKVAAKEVDLNKLVVIWRSPAYYDYHWLINPQVKQRYGADFVTKVQNALLKLDPTIPEHKEILELLDANKFVTTQNSNYAQIEQVGREIGKIK